MRSDNSNANSNSNSNADAEPEAPKVDPQIALRQSLVDKITHILIIFPRVSPSMLQVGLGTSLSPQVWKPVWKHMIAHGWAVEKNETHVSSAGRRQTYTIYCLTERYIAMYHEQQMNAERLNAERMGDTLAAAPRIPGLTRTAE